MGLTVTVVLTNAQLVKGKSQEVVELRQSVRDELRSVMEYTGPPDAALEALPMHLMQRLREFLASAPLQDARVARFRAYMLEDFVGDPAHVTTGAGSPTFPATKWAHVSGYAAMWPGGPAAIGCAADLRRVSRYPGVETSI